MRKNIITLISLVLILGSISSAYAYPISPRPLRKLIKGSETIVYVDVIQIKETKPDSGWLIDVKAILVVQDILQGKVKDDTLEVGFMPYMICPAPANYEVGTKVLAFLNTSKDGSYYTSGLSYGTKRLEEEEFQIYKKRINEMQKIQKIILKSKRTQATIDWLIRCASEPITRWEGVYELSPKSDFMSYYDQDKDTFVQKFKLSEKQKVELRSVILSSKKLVYADIGMVDLVGIDNDKELSDFLVLRIKQDEIKWYYKTIMSRIADAYESDELKKIVYQLDEYHCQNEKSKQLVQTFVAQYLSETW